MCDEDDGLSDAVRVMRRATEIDEAEGGVTSESPAPPSPPPPTEGESIPGDLIALPGQGIRRVRRRRPRP